METYFYNCSNQYIDSIHLSLYGKIQEAISKLPKRPTQAQINQDLFWLLTSKEWAYDTLPFNGGMPNWLRLFLVCIITAQCWLGYL